jgi:DNA/RNA endonuclease G (NUC1)
MRFRIRSAALVALALAVGSCSDNGGLGPEVRPAPVGGPSFDVTSAAALPAVRISEIHYDNTGTDAGERIEVSAPLGTSLSGWSIVLYNGSGGAAYDTDPLTDLATTTCTAGTRFVVVLAYLPNGIQNGSPDGVALVDAAGAVVEFLSYEGTFAATTGPASGMTSTDIGVSEAGTEPVGQSLKRNGAGAWSGPTAHSFGTCNDDDEPPPPPPPPPPSALPDTRLSEIHYDNFGTDAGEAIEIEGPTGTDVTGWQIVLYNGNGGASYNTKTLSGTIPATCGTRGVVSVTYPQDGIQNGSPDGVALVDAAGQVVEFLSYEGTFTATNGPANGRTSTDIGVSQNSSPVGQSLQRDSVGAWKAPAAATFGLCNDTPPPPPSSTITFSGRAPSDVPLPVGFEDQIFATLRDPSGNVVETTFTWSSETPAIASIDQSGVMHALDAGTATVRATAADGTTATYSLPTRVATASTTAQYAGNAEFGEPADGDASDDFIVRRDQYTASYNKNKGTPNWVSYNIDSTHFGPEDRCDCFTHDPALPASFPRLTTANYTGAGTFHGYGIDRGHLARSFDRTAGSLDNARTFYFTNIIPQAADNNQGPWSAMEIHLGDLARKNDREVYVIAGVAGSKGTVKDSGKITIPAKVWKVAVVMPRNQGLANIDGFEDLANVEVIAVIMPNEPGIRNVDWTTYKTTVDAVETLSGYDLLARLRNDIEIAVESNTKPPTAVVDGPYTSAEGSAVSMSGAGSSDPDGDALTYSWSFGDGTAGAGVSVAHTYAQDGAYTVRLIVTDIRGLADTTTTSAKVSNVAPDIGAFPGATLLPGETYNATGSFTDPGADPWTATVDYGDGSGVKALALTGKSFRLSHTYNVAGTFTVTVRVSDDDATTARQQTVIVLTHAQGARKAAGMIEDLVRDGTLARGAANSLTAKLDAAAKQFERDHVTPAVNQLEAFLHELDALVRSDRLRAADAEPPRALVRRVIRSAAS